MVKERSALNEEDQVMDGIKFVRYCQNLVRSTIFNFRKLQALSKEELEGNVLDIARGIGVAPVMVIRYRMKLDGFSKREIREMIDGSTPTPEKYRAPLDLALRNDPVFSPNGIRFSKKRGEIGEELIAAWLSTIPIGFGRDEGQGGPDFLLKQRLRLDINGEEHEFDWIESKASYGDAFKLKQETAQFEKYEFYGHGFVIYWYGIDQKTSHIVLTWREMLNLVDPTLKNRIRSFIAFVPFEFKHLIS